MPKLKTNKATVKRFRVTARGKILYSRAGKSHLLSSKNAKRRRHLRKASTLHTFNEVLVNRLLVTGGRGGRGVPNPPPPGQTPETKKN
jgi:large subunit ribosomal protein L35